MKKIFLTIIVALIVGISVGSFAQADTPKQSWWQFFKMLKRAPEKQLVPVQPQRPATEPGRESVKETPDNKPGPGREVVKETPDAKTGPVRLRWSEYRSDMELASKKDENQDNKYVYINFYGKWCHFCKKMEKETFNNQDVASYLDENFLLYQVNGDEAADLTRKYVIRGYPTGLFMDPAGNVIASLPGFWPPDKFLDVLKFIKSESYKQMSYEEYASKRHN